MSFLARRQVRLRLQERLRPRDSLEMALFPQREEDHTNGFHTEAGEAEDSSQSENEPDTMSSQDSSLHLDDETAELIDHQQHQIAHLQATCESLRRSRDHLHNENVAMGSVASGSYIQQLKEEQEHLVFQNRDLRNTIAEMTRNLSSANDAKKIWKEKTEELQTEKSQMLQDGSVKQNQWLSEVLRKEGRIGELEKTVRNLEGTIYGLRIALSRNRSDHIEQHLDLTDAQEKLSDMEKNYKVLTEEFKKVRLQSKQLQEDNDNLRAKLGKQWLDLDAKDDDGGDEVEMMDEAWSNMEV